MKNILIYADLHIDKENLKECILVLEEIGMLANKYNVDTTINLGDTFNGLKPSSQELDVFATFINRLGNDKQHIILAANSHESETEQNSIMNHFGILSNNIQVVKEYKSDNHLYCGHYSLKESSSNYDAKISKTALKDFVYVFLGHIHSYEVIKPNICHLGSSRWVSFSEIHDKHKIVALITDYNGAKEQVHFLKLKSPTPMVEFILNSNKINKLEEKDTKNTPTETISGTNLIKNDDVGKDTQKVESMISEGENPPNPRQIEVLCQKLDNLPPKTKVKVKIMDFDSYREFLPLTNKYTSKFEIFKYEAEFNTVKDLAPIRAKTEMTTFTESFTNWLNQQNIDPKIKEILQKEIK